MKMNPANFMRPLQCIYLVCMLSLANVVWAQQPQCSASGTYKQLHFSDCSKYYDCTEGESTEYRCTFWFLGLQRFDKNSQTCKWFWQAPCETYPLPATNTTFLPQCSPKLEYSKLYPGDCGKYYYCDKGILTVRKCNLLQNFDPTTKSCRLFLAFTCSEQQA